LIHSSPLITSFLWRCTVNLRHLYCPFWLNSLRKPPKNIHLQILHVIRLLHYISDELSVYKCFALPRKLFLLRLTVQSAPPCVQYHYLFTVMCSKINSFGKGGSPWISLYAFEKYSSITFAVFCTINSITSAVTLYAGARRIWSPIFPSASASLQMTWTTSLMASPFSWMFIATLSFGSNENTYSPEEPLSSYITNMGQRSEYFQRRSTTDRVTLVCLSMSKRASAFEERVHTRHLALFQWSVYLERRRSRATAKRALCLYDPYHTLLRRGSRVPRTQPKAFALFKAASIASEPAICWFCDDIWLQYYALPELTIYAFDISPPVDSTSSFASNSAASVANVAEYFVGRCKLVGDVIDKEM
ncbi:hypothetical protein KCU81_g589, partial [Aureobasidium melanogenum]